MEYLYKNRSIDQYKKWLTTLKVLIQKMDSMVVGQYF